MKWIFARLGLEICGKRWYSCNLLLDSILELVPLDKLNQIMVSSHTNPKDSCHKVGCNQLKEELISINQKVEAVANASKGLQANQDLLGVMVDQALLGVQETQDLQAEMVHFCHRHRKSRHVRNARLDRQARMVRLVQRAFQELKEMLEKPAEMEPQDDLDHRAHQGLLDHLESQERRVHLESLEKF